MIVTLAEPLGKGWFWKRRNLQRKAVRSGGSSLSAEHQEPGVRLDNSNYMHILMREAIRLAYEARKHYHDETIWITNEIIHNPTVNKGLEDMKVKVIPIKNGEKQFDVINKGDVVVFPAFWASINEMLILDNKQVKIVDTTCPWISKVWNTVIKHDKEDYTSIIHGKYSHEETVATTYFAGKYIIVDNMNEHMYVITFLVVNLMDLAQLNKRFRDTDLVKAGVANQTTMLKGETEDIGKLLYKTMMTKYGMENAKKHFISFNTICEATQALLLTDSQLISTIYDGLTLSPRADTEEKERENRREMDTVKEDMYKEKYWGKSIQELDLSYCQRCTPSYRLLPDDKGTVVDKVTEVHLND
ncbi:hypothetical protein L2E82_22640 [Cichorium intybus]|uniref:Uncharacterized protein n=1 Tax=Cichorium intybus TaxID=13427 RepID=A0ACB9DYL0_CICIN|nr:hypothetical protein L2E82_22640 [Cichorium intybus]